MSDDDGHAEADNDDEDAEAYIDDEVPADEDDEQVKYFLSFDQNKIPNLTAFLLHLILINSPKNFLFKIDQTKKDAWEEKKGD